ncbi:MAG TPA: flagellar basal body P-ring protein FlgI [Pirellulaceae bacterium]|nr:flagellar basal body P-ring protein FlgI [Pirellulaceae bacterium]
MDAPRNRSSFRLSEAPAWTRRGFLLLGLFGLTGCKSFFKKKDEEPEFDDSLFDDTRPRFIGEISRVWGTGFAKVESVALVTNLSGTGSQPPADDLRKRLLNEMKILDVRNPNELLDSNTTSLVLVRGLLPPGIQRGDTYDIEVYVPRRSETTSLANGHLMPTRLTTADLIGSVVRTGHVLSTGEGPVLVDAVFWDGDETLKLHGRVLGGGVAQQSRPIGLEIRDDAQSVAATVRLAAVINARFDTYVDGTKTGVATPKNNRAIELLIPKQYRFNIGRYLQVVRNLPYNETAAMRGPLLEELDRQLAEPLTAGPAAAKLEAIGKEGQRILVRGLTHPDPEVRFLSAEALAYQGLPEAAPVLGQMANAVAPFRWHAITALASMDDVEAGSALANLLHHPEIETRYGAFRAMLARAPFDPTIAGRKIGQFHLHVLVSAGPPAIHFARVRRPEIVLFGHDQRLDDRFMMVGPGLTVQATGDGQLKISKYDHVAGDQVRICSNRIAVLIETLGAMGIRYGDLLKFFRDADAKQLLPGQLAVHAIPDPNRRYDRSPGQLALPDQHLPELFADPSDRPDEWRNDGGERLLDAAAVDIRPEEEPNLFQRVGDWLGR